MINKPRLANIRIGGTVKSGPKWCEHYGLPVGAYRNWTNLGLPPSDALYRVAMSHDVPLNRNSMEDVLYEKDLIVEGAAREKQERETIIYDVCYWKQCGSIGGYWVTKRRISRGEYLDLKQNHHVEILREVKYS